MIIMNMDWILEYCSDYEILVEFDNIENKNGMQEIHGLKERTNTRCMFCGNPFEYWEKKDIAHAISECLGNKKLINFCECYECNHLFGEIAENHLGKFIMPYRIITGVYGKGKFKNVVKDMPQDEKLSYGTYRYEQKKNAPIFQSETFDVRNMLIEKAGTGRLTETENGFTCSIPRQRYEPQMVYVSLLKMAYTLLPVSELEYYIKGKLGLYFNISMNHFYDENGHPLVELASSDERKKYIDSLPNIGVEIKLSSNTIADGVNVCLLKRIQEVNMEPKLLFAVQMKWYTIIIPILSDNYKSGELCKLNVKGTDNATVRELNFSKVEDEFIYDIVADKIDIPKELYGELEADLRKSGLLKEKEE